MCYMMSSSSLVSAKSPIVWCCKPPRRICTCRPLTAVQQTQQKMLLTVVMVMRRQQLLRLRQQPQLPKRRKRSSQKTMSPTLGSGRRHRWTQSMLVAGM